MIPLALRADTLELAERFVTRLRMRRHDWKPGDALAVRSDASSTLFSCDEGLFAVDGIDPQDLDGDVVLVDGRRGRVERLLRSGSTHNTLVVTERCDQLCVMCSQPPRKTHDDRFELLERACQLAVPNAVVGISGGEPTLYKAELLGMLERAIEARPDLSFHVLSNGQHFDATDVATLRRPAFRRVVWGIPLYAADAALHDIIVVKPGAFKRLEESFATLLLAGAAIELRTVVTSLNARFLPTLARHVTRRLPFVASWSIMQLENIGFAKNRWADLYYDHRFEFEPIGHAIDIAVAHGLRPRLFNFPRCSVPTAFRGLAVASISDWKRRYADACGPCGERDACTGFFEWHPTGEMEAMADPL